MSADASPHLVIKHAALFTSTILSRVLAMPNVVRTLTFSQNTVSGNPYFQVMVNATAVEDLIICVDYSGRQRVTGVVTNWTLVA
jgi:thiamine thiazole synthase